MIRSDIIRLAKKLIMQGDIDPLWNETEWSIFFDEAVDLVHEALVDSDTGFYEVRDLVIEPDEENRYQLPEDFHSMIYVEDSLGRLEYLTPEEERDSKTTGYIILGDKLEIRNSDSRPSPIKIDYYRLPKTMPLYEGGSDEGNSVSNDPADFVPDPPLDTDRGAKVLARIMQYLAQSKDGTMTEAVTTQINRVVDRFTDRLYRRQKR